MTWSCGDRVVITGLVVRPELNGSPGSIVKYNQDRDRYGVKHDRGCHWVKRENLLSPLQFAIGRIEGAPLDYKSAKRYAVADQNGVIPFIGPVMLTELRLRRRDTLEQACERMKGMPTHDRLIQLTNAFNYSKKTSLDDIRFWETKNVPPIPDGCAAYYHETFDYLSESDTRELMGILSDTYHFSYPAALLYARLHPEYQPICGCLYMGLGPTGRPDIEFRSRKWSIDETPSFRQMQFHELLPDIGDRVIVDKESAMWLEEDVFHNSGTVIAQDDGKCQVAFVADSACGQSARIVHLPTHCFLRTVTAAHCYNGVIELTKTLLGALHASLDLLSPGTLAHEKRKAALETIDNAVTRAMDCPHGCCYTQACKTVYKAFLEQKNDAAPPYSP